MSEESSPKDKDLIVWIDMEMTGLDPQVEEIIEIATIITDKDLNIVATGPELVCHQDESRFEKMDDWNQKQHKKSGLWDKVIASKISMKEAEKQTLDFIKQYVPERTAPLAGNSVWQDRRFLNRYMKSIDDYLHYRIIDVSSFKECICRWFTDFKEFEKQNTHRALDDIKESINELAYYKKNYFQETENK